MRRLLWLALGLAGCDRNEAPVTFPAESGGQVGQLGEIPNLVELPGGRLAFADPENQQLVLVDRTSGHVTRIGRAGRGPGEFAQPYQVARAGNRLLVVDGAQGRIVRFTLDGEYVADSVLPRGLASGFVLAPDGRALVHREDSVPQAEQVAGTLGWFDVQREHFSPITRIATRRWIPVPDGPARLNAIERFGAFDGAGVAEDGTVWVARAESQRIEWQTPGGWEHSAPLGIERIASVAAEQTVAPYRGREFQLPMAPVKGPFSVAISGPDSEVWLQLQGRYRDSVTTLMVVPRRGEIQRFSVPAGRVLRAAGKEWLYLTYEDDDGFTILEWRRRALSQPR